MANKDKDDIFFRCRTCRFTAKSKVDMADHFMEIHAAVEIIESSDLQRTQSSITGKGQAEGSNETIKMEETVRPEEDQPKEKVRTPVKRKPGFRSNAIRSTISHLVRAAEQASKEEWSSNSGTSKRRIQQSTAVEDIGKTVHVVGRELRKQKMKRKFEDYIVYGNEGSKSKQAKSSSSDNGSKISLSGRRAKSDKQQVSRRKTPRTKKRVKEEDMSKLSISAAELKKKMEEQLKIWSEKWVEKDKANMKTCDKENCNQELSDAEMILHKQCHMKNFYGFRCPHCDYMHSRWRNMRCHIYDSHNEIERPLMKCDWPACSESFTALWGLKRHMQRDHIQQKLMREFTPGFEGSLDQPNEEKAVKDLNNSEKQPSSTDSQVVKKTYRPRRRKKVTEEIPDEEDQDGDAVKKMKKKFHRMTWLPSCSVCEAKYIAVEMMDSHMALHAVEEDDKKVKCSECGIVLDTKSLLKEHMKKCHQRLLKVYRCDLCKYAGDRHFDFRKHLLTHADTKPCMCEVCGKLMSTRYNLKVHRMRVHATEEEKTIECQHCAYRCADIIVLKDHMRFQHNLMWNGDLYKDAEKLRTYKCDLCAYVGKKEKSLKYHMRVHTENRQFRCNLCAYASKTKNNLFLHMRTHGGMKPIKCPQCDYRGATNKVVNEHVLSKHSCTRPFRCPCGWSSSYSGNMWKHMQQHRERGDGYKAIADKMYGGQKSKKGELMKKEDVKDASLSTQTVIAIVQEFDEGEHMEAENAHPSRLITISGDEITAEGGEEGSSKLSQLDVLPIIGGDLQLNNLAEAVCLAANKDAGQGTDNQEDSQLQSNQAAHFLSKLAHAVSTGQVVKPMTVGKGLGLECEEQTTDTSDPTIQELVLW